MTRDATFGLALGALTFLLTVIWGGPLITLLKRYRIGKQIRVDGPQSHFVKTGTPTMGGLMIVAPVIAIFIFINIVKLLRRDLAGFSILLPLGVLVLATALGVVDDWVGLKGVKRGEGLRGRIILQAQVGIAFLAALALYFVLDTHSVYIPSIPFPIDFDLVWPFMLGPFQFSVGGIAYIVIATFVITGASNATNITDGLDGMCGYMSATAFAAYGIIALLQGQIFLVQFCFIMVGAVFAFLWFNAHPAEMFMGGSGSYSLGAVLGVIALMTGQWLILPIIIIVQMAVTISVILQTSYFKLTRRLYGEPRRLFKMAPLHHHFELSGWSETQIVQRFWLVAVLAAMVGIALALL